MLKQNLRRKSKIWYDLVVDNFSLTYRKEKKNSSCDIAVDKVRGGNIIPILGMILGTKLARDLQVPAYANVIRGAVQARITGGLEVINFYSLHMRRCTPFSFLFIFY